MEYGDPLIYLSRSQEAPKRKHAKELNVISNVKRSKESRVSLRSLHVIYMKDTKGKEGRMKREMKYHFSHPHPLTPYEALEHEQIQCSGCELPGSGLLYGCNQCRYFLHEHCRNIGRWMMHPSHIKHELTLFPKPTYPKGSFKCDGCGSPGQAFSLSCAPCKFDLHIQCALLPRSIVHKDHPKHALALLYEFPVDESEIFWCDACHLIVDRECWVYYCQECDYGTHLGCALPLSHLMSHTGKQTETRVLAQTVGDGSLSRKDEEENQLKKMVEQMMDTGLEITRLQNELTSQTAQLMSSVCR